MEFSGVSESESVDGDPEMIIKFDFIFRIYFT